MAEMNKNIEMITGDPKKAIMRLALPMMLSMLLIMLYNIADSIWVAGLGPDALAAIGFVTPLFMVLVGLGNGIGAGANSLIARYIGAGDYDSANNAGLHGLLLCVVISAVFTILIEVFMVPILQLLGAGPTIQYAMDYSYIIFGFLFVFVYAGVASAIFRSEGDMKRATVAIAVTTIMNIILDPIFIYVLNLGISGAAWATVISSTTSCLVMTYWIWGKKDLFLDLTLKNFHYSTKMIIDNLQVAIPSSLESIVFSILGIVINAFLVQAGDTTSVAVYTASMRIVQLAMIPLMGLGTALLTVAGVAYGARNPDNLRIAHLFAFQVGLVISIILAIIMYLFSGQLAGIFSYTEASAVLAPQIAEAIAIFSLFVIVLPHGMMSSMVFQGVGKGTYSLIITLLRSLILEIVCAYILCFTLGWGVPGIYIGLILGCFIGGTLGFIWAKLFIRSFAKSVKAS